MNKVAKIVVGFLIIIALGILISVVDRLYGITYSNNWIEISYKIIVFSCLFGCGYTGYRMTK